MSENLFAGIPKLDAAGVLRRFGLRADKSLGQNFLQDAQVLEKIARAAGIRASETVLEIGPGLGSLTRYLAVAAQKVVAVELDGDIIPALRAVMAPYSNVRVEHGDILKTDLFALMGEEPYVVVANIPYYITSAIMRHLLESKARPRCVVLTIQKEVAERICAKPGDMSLLALSVQVYGTPVVVDVIPAAAFHPVPKVDSAILKVDLHAEPAVPEALLPVFFRLSKAGFSQKRKTLRNALGAGLHIQAQEAGRMLEAAGIDPMRRAETLSLEEWEKLCEFK